MEHAKNFVLVCACVLIAWGCFGLTATWLLPKLQKSPLLGSKMFLARLEPTRTNLTLVSLWVSVFGVFLSSSVLQYRLLFWASFIIVAPLAIWLMVCMSEPGRKA